MQTSINAAPLNDTEEDGSPTNENAEEVIANLIQAEYNSIIAWLDAMELAERTADDSLINDIISILLNSIQLPVEVNKGVTTESRAILQKLQGLLNVLLVAANISSIANGGTGIEIISPGLSGLLGLSPSVTGVGIGINNNNTGTNISAGGVGNVGTAPGTAPGTGLGGLLGGLLGR